MGGCILLSDVVVNTTERADGIAAETTDVARKRCKYGDQVGGLPASTCRNFFGRQAESFEACLTAARDCSASPTCWDTFEKYPAVFIRAPAILRLEEGACALACVQHPLASEQGLDSDRVVVAAESKHVLVTCFHPELSSDSRIHRYFVERFVLSGGDCR